jgi:predicted amidohydrolase YtcJ
VVNTAALEAAGIDESAPNPDGGQNQRDASGRLTGVLFEDSHETAMKAVPQPSLDQMVDAIMHAGERLRAMGITCASDMMTGFYDLETELEAYQIAASKGSPLSLRLYVQWKAIFGPRGVGIERFRELTADLDESIRVGGVKLFADGALSSATAAIYGNYTGAPAQGRRISRHGRPASGPEGVEVSGQLIYSTERLTNMVQKAHDAGFQIATHSIGDFSTDIVLDAYESTREPNRHRIEHAMILSDSQIERFSRSNITITYQPEFLMGLGTAYLRHLGPERTANLIRTRSTIDAGVRVGFSSDLPVVRGNPWNGILTASRRPPMYSAHENCTRLEAIDLYTRGAADANGAADEMGSLTPGQFAHFNLFDRDPLTAPDPGLCTFNDDLRYLAA